MKEIKAIIYPHMVQKVVHALRALEHFPGFTLLDGRGEGRGRGAGGAYVATEDAIDYHPKAVIVIVCAGETVPAITEAILRAAHTGKKGDGIITVGDLGEVIRIRTGEKNNQAV